VLQQAFRLLYVAVEKEVKKDCWNDNGDEEKQFN
jgi:hypothetical protein